MKNPFISDYDQNPSEGEILKRVTFLKVKDIECDVVVWKYEVEIPSVVAVSNRSFDTFAEAVEDFLDSRKKEP
jgi:hypothetical protein